jgi:hypothetical protein
MDRTPTQGQDQQVNKDLDNDADSTSAEITLEGTNVKVDDIPEEYRDKVEEIRKGFQRAFTKKSQSLAQKEKDLTDKVKKADEWDGWYSTNKASIEAYNANINDFSEYLKSKRSGGVSDDIDHIKEDDTGDLTSKQINKAIKIAQDAATSTKDLQERATAALKMLMRTQSLSMSPKYKDLGVDPEKVMDFASRRGITDMDEAIQGAYSKEIKETEFAKRLEEEKEKWSTQQNTNVLSGNMPMGKVVRKVLARERGKSA